MKLVNADLGLEIPVTENKVVVLVAENPNMFSSIVNQIIRQCEGEEGGFILSNGSILKIDKCMDVIINPFETNLNNRKLLNTLYSNLILNGDNLYDKKAQINSIILETLDEMIIKEGYSGLEFNLDFNWNDIFKMYNMRFTDNYENLLCKMIEYIKVMAQYCFIKIVVLVGIKNYFNETQLNELYMAAQYVKVALMLIESSEREKIPLESYIILDKDDCVIVK